ncbi:SsrA-binding protein SmpB [Thermonema lapsum]
MSSKKKFEFSKSVNIKNKRAYFEYHILDTYEAGIVLTGSEIKSIRLGKVQLQQAYCYFDKGELWIKDMHISPYEQGGHYNHEPMRPRKLLLHKRELRKLKEKLEEKGLTLIPTRLYINDRGWAKVEIALARGKKLYDKRETIKKREQEREIARKEW